MELLPSNFQDIRKYYCESFVKLHEFGDQLFYITKVTDSSVFFKDENGKEGIIYLHEDVPYSFSMTLPHKSLYQMGSKCYSIARFPARQYSKGISGNNCRIATLELYGWENQSVDFNVLKGFVTKPSFPSLEEGITKKEYASVALSSRFAYSMGNIYCDTHRVGTIMGTVITINPLFKAEFTLLLQNTMMIRLFSFKEQEQWQ